MALTKVSTDGVKDDAITKTKIPANQIEASELADNAVDTNAIANNAVTAGKLASGVQTTINNNANNRLITGSGTANTLEGEANLLFDGTDTLEIGTAAGGSGYDSNMKLRIGRTSDAQICVRNTNGDTNYGGLIFGDQSSSFGGGIQYHHNGDSMRFYTAGSTERLRIDSSGRMFLGLSSTSFPKKLNVQGSSGAIIALKNHDTTSYAADTNTSIEFGLNTGNTGNQNGACEIRAFKENGTNGNNARALSFYTGSNGGSNTERMRIDSAGRVFIGTTSGSERLKVETTANTMVPMTINDSSNTSTLTHRILFSTGGTEVGRIRCTNSGTQYNTSGSDRSMKKNFELWDEDVLSLFKNINPQKFNFIQEKDGATKSKGFIAQELANSFPEAYSKGEEEDDKYWFNPSGMVVYLMKALQEAIAKIEVLETKVAALEAG